MAGARLQQPAVRRRDALQGDACCACCACYGVPPLLLAMNTSRLLAARINAWWYCRNLPAEIVPPRQRNLVYAFDRCFEGGWCWEGRQGGQMLADATAATGSREAARQRLGGALNPPLLWCAGAIAACAAPLVGLLAERVFGFTGSGTGGGAGRPAAASMRPIQQAPCSMAHAFTVDADPAGRPLCSEPRPGAGPG